MTDPAQANVDITEHVVESLGYLLYTGEAPVYDRETGVISLQTVEDVMPGATIRPAHTLLDDAPFLDNRDREVAPYITWFQRSTLPIQAEAYGGRIKSASFWEMNARLGAVHLADYYRIQGFLTSLLMRYRPQFDVYFWHQVSVSSNTVVSRGDIIAQGIISDVTVVPRIDVAMARGEDNYIVLNFTLGIWQQEED